MFTSAEITKYFLARLLNFAENSLYSKNKIVDIPEKKYFLKPNSYSKTQAHFMQKVLVFVKNQLFPQSQQTVSFGGSCIKEVPVAVAFHNRQECCVEKRTSTMEIKILEVYDRKFLRLTFKLQQKVANFFLHNPENLCEKLFQRLSQGF